MRRDEGVVERVGQGQENDAAAEAGPDCRISRRTTRPRRTQAQALDATLVAQILGQFVRASLDLGRRMTDRPADADLAEEAPEESSGDASLGASAGVQPGRRTRSRNGRSLIGSSMSESLSHPIASPKKPSGQYTVMPVASERPSLISLALGETPKTSGKLLHERERRRGVRAQDDRLARRLLAFGLRDVRVEPRQRLHAAARLANELAAPQAVFTGSHHDGERCGRGLDASPRTSRSVRRDAWTNAARAEGWRTRAADAWPIVVRSFRSAWAASDARTRGCWRDRTTGQGGGRQGGRATASRATCGNRAWAHASRCRITPVHLTNPRQTEAERASPLTCISSRKFGARASAQARRTVKSARVR